MKRFSVLLLLIAVFTGCQKSADTPDTGKLDPQIEEAQLERDLEQIKEDGVLKAITVYSGTSYFLYRGQPMGFEYELLERLAKYLDVELKIVVAHDINELITMLNRGDGDIVAHGLTITNERKEFISFTDYLYLTRQVLVQKKPEDWREKSRAKVQKELVTDPIELIGDTVSVRKHTSYFQRIQNLEEEIGGDIHVDTVSGTKSTNRIIREIVEGEHEYTVADNNIAEITSSYYPRLNTETEMSFSQRIAWAVRNNSPQLLEAVNDWLAGMKKDVDYYVIYNKYFKNQRSFRARTKSDFYSKNSGKISRYDEIIKENATKIGWDWRFVSSVVYQESRFRPNARSWASARGLMQLMPATARELGVIDVTNPRQNIRGGTKYLKTMYDRWESIPDSIQRIKFTLASYNCGYSHVVDAQNLAKKYGKNPKVWDDNVEKFVLKLSFPKYYNDEIVKYGYARGIEPVTYVRQIFQRYEHYRDLIPK